MAVNEIKAKQVIKFKADREQCQGLMALRAAMPRAAAAAAVTSLLSSRAGNQMDSVTRRKVQERSTLV